MGWCVAVLVDRNGKYMDYMGESDLMDLSIIHNLELPKDRKYSLSLDQSSSCTGFYLTDTKTSFHLVGHIERRNQDKNKFFASLMYFVMRMIRDAELELFVTEKVNFARQTYALPVLAQLKGYINHWYIDIPELGALAPENRDDIAPPTWKKHFYDKSKKKGTFNNKREMAKSIMEVFPELQPYFNRVPQSSDYDGFDAVGILHGYRKEYRLGDRVNQIGGSQEYQGNIMVYYRLATMEDISDRDKLMEGFELQLEQGITKNLKMNPEKSWYENVKMAATKYDFVLTVIEDPHVDLSLRWMLDLDQDDRTFLAYILKKTKISKGQLNLLSSLYKSEEVSW